MFEQFNFKQYNTPTLYFISANQDKCMFRIGNSSSKRFVVFTLFYNSYCRVFHINTDIPSKNKTMIHHIHQIAEDMACFLQEKSPFRMKCLFEGIEIKINMHSYFYTLRKASDFYDHCESKLENAHQKVRDAMFVQTYLKLMPLICLIFLGLSFWNMTASKGLLFVQVLFLIVGILSESFCIINTHNLMKEMQNCKKTLLLFYMNIFFNFLTMLVIKALV